MATDCTKWPNKGRCVGCHVVDLARNIPKASPPSKSPASNPPHPPRYPLPSGRRQPAQYPLLPRPPQHPSQLRHTTKPANRSRQNIATNPITYLQRPVLAHARPNIHLPIDRLCRPSLPHTQHLPSPLTRAACPFLEHLPSLPAHSSQVPFQSYRSSIFSPRRHHHPTAKQAIETTPQGPFTDQPAA